MHNYKPGDKVKVVNLPKGKSWVSPRGKTDLKNGDTLELTPPIYTIPLLGCPDNTYVYFKVSANMRGWIPIDWIEPIETIPLECKCDIWVTGCVCGVFQTENRNEK